MRGDADGEPRHRQCRFARVTSSLGPHVDSACSVSDEPQASKRRDGSKRKCGRTSGWLLRWNDSSTLGVAVADGRHVPGFVPNEAFDVAPSGVRTLPQSVEAAVGERLSRPPALALAAAPRCRRGLVLCHGADSPVIADSSTVAIPSITVPSQGITPPASITTTSPGMSSEAAFERPSGSRATASWRRERGVSGCAGPRPPKNALRMRTNTVVSRSLSEVVSVHRPGRGDR